MIERTGPPTLLRLVAYALFLFPADQVLAPLGASGSVAMVLALLLTGAWAASALLGLHDPIPMRHPGRAALTLLLLELGVLAMRSGARKSARRRAELQRLRRVEAEVQTRQSAEAQRNATAAPVASAPAPFARRDSSDSDTGRTQALRDSHETSRDDSSRLGTVRPDSYRQDTSGTGGQAAVSDTRPPGYDSQAGGAGATVDEGYSDGASRTDRA